MEKVGRNNVEHPHPDSTKILGLIEDAKEGKVVLPEFQRNFVWTNSDIKDLLVSIGNGYFIGSILFLRRGSTPLEFEPRFLDGVKQVNLSLPQHPENKNVDKVVLDGQQRLTALFYALYHPPDIKPKGANNPYRYFLKFDRDLRVESPDWDDGCVESISENDSTRNMEINLGNGLETKSFRELLKWAGGFSDLLETEEFKKFCFENCMIPFAHLRSMPELDDWLDDYRDYISENGVRPEESKEKKGKVRKIFYNWFDFEVATLTLENRRLYEVAEIFERINRTGVELSVFALATAVFFKKDENKNLRNWWEEYYEREGGYIRQLCKKDDEDYPKYLLQIMALVQNKEVKKKVLLDSKVFDVNEESWGKACKLLDESLKRLLHNRVFGVISKDYLPYKPIVVTLAAVSEFCKTAKDFKKVSSWYWSSVLTGRFAGASDTKIKQDYDQLKKWFNADDKIPDVITTAEARIKDEMNLRATERGALPKAIFNMTALEGALDFLKEGTIELLTLNDHHIFPKRSGVKLTYENSILNRTLIADETNKVILAKKPSEYLKLMEKSLGSEEKVKEVLRTHLIDERCFIAMREDNYEEFLSAREDLFIKKMKSKISEYK